jgi:hypothetical protein
MSILFGDPRKMAPVRKGDGDATEAERTQRRRSEVAAQAAPSRRSDPRGHFLNFNDTATSAPAKARNTTGGVMDCYGGVTRSDAEVRRAEREERMSRLPIRVQRLATDQGVTDLDLLHVVGAVVAKSDTWGGNRVQLFSSDLGRTLGISTQKADALLDEAVRRGFIEAYSRSIGGGYFRPCI